MRTLLMLLVLPAFAGVPTKMPEDRDKGRQIWRDSCWQCHGWTGEGSGPVASALPTPSPALAGRVTEDDYDRLIGVIQDGSGDMPSFSAILDERDAKRVLIWLASLDKDHPKDDGDDEKPGDKAKSKTTKANNPKPPRAIMVPADEGNQVEIEDADPPGPIAVPVEQEGGGP